MSIRRNILDNITNLILSVILSFSLTYAMTTTMGIKYKPALIIAAISIFSLILSGVTINKSILKISLISFGLLLVGSASFIIYKFGINEVSINIEFFFNWLYDYVVLEKGRLIDIYALIISIIFCITFSTIVFIFTIKKPKFLVLLILGSTLFIVQYSYKFLVSYASFYIFLFVILIYYFRHIYQKNSSKESNEYLFQSGFIAFILPICCILLGLVFLLPTKSKPIEWKWMDTKFQKLYSSMFKTSGPSKYDYFSLSSSGFGRSDGELGGKITKNKKLVLKVDSPRSIYIKGTVKDFYTGRSWQQTTKEYTDMSTNDKKGFIDLNDQYSMNQELQYFNSTSFYKNTTFTEYIELMAGTKLLSNENDLISKYFTKDKISITVQNMSTKTLFCPSNTFQLNAGNTVLQSNPNGDIISNKRVGKNYKYSMFSYTLDDRITKVADLLRKSHKGLYQESTRTSNDMLSDLAKKIESVCNSFKSNENTPIEIISVGNFKALVFADDRDLSNYTNTESLDINVNSTNSEQNIEDLVTFIYNTNPNIEQNTKNPLVFYGYQAVPYSVYQTVIQNSIEPPENLYISSIPLFIQNGIKGYVIPLNTETVGVISTTFDFSTNYNINTSSPYLRNIMEILNENQKIAYSKYLQLPDNMPSRVKDLAVSITSKYNNTYDKTKAIESYLSNEFYYTLAPDNTPKGRDFVDYFLFDLKKGYCTYYASSMVVMLRSIGIPARYVEGFLVSGKKKNNVYDVTNERAHAWTEVYFEGFGWVRFEPTATFGYFADNSRSSNVDDRNPSRPSWLDRARPSDHPLSASPIQEQKNSNFRLYIIIAIVLGIILFVSGLLLLYNMIKSKLRLKHIRKMSPRESIISSYSKCLKLFAILGYEMQHDETPFEYSKRMQKLYLTKNSEFESVTKYFVAARYSDNEIGENEKNICINFLTDLLSITKINLGKLKYFIFKYISGRI